MLHHAEVQETTAPATLTAWRVSSAHAHALQNLGRGLSGSLGSLNSFSRWCGTCVHLDTDRVCPHGVSSGRGEAT